MNVGIAVGCSRYDDPRIADLKYAHEDANRIAERLSSVVGVDDGAMVVLHDGMSDPSLAPTRANLVRELVRLSRSVDEPVDLLVFFFSGHGFRSTVDGSDYLLLADSVEEVLEETSVRFELVLGLLRAVGANHVLLFLDACRAAASSGKSIGATVGRAMVGDLHPSGMVSFTSCEPGTLSYEADELGGGVFSAALSDGLSEAGRCVTVEDLSRYLRTAVPALSRRTGKPVQVPHTRVEPLELKDLELVAPAVRNSWHSASRVGRELRSGTVAPIAVPVGEEPMVAVDFGTTYSAVGVPAPDGGVRYVHSADGRVLVPSVVSFTEQMDYLVGARAVEAEAHHPERTVRDVKRRLGTGRLLRVGDQSLTPELVASLIIRSLRDDASAALDVPVRRCVAAYPANFSSRQKAALRQAFELAGLEVARMVGEPNCAGLLPLFDPSAERTCLVVDLGGGTVDVALVEIDDGVSEVRSVAGDNELGGLDYDEAILGVVRGRLVDAHPGLVVTEQMTVELRREAERAKRLLSNRDEAVVVVRDLPTEHGLDDVELVVTRDEVRAAVGHLDERIVRLVHAVLGGRDLSGTWVPVSPESVDAVVFSGFGGKMFTVREAVRAAGIRGEFLEKYQELGVVHGLTGQAGVLTGHKKDVLLLDLTHRAFGLRAERVAPGRYRKTATSPSFEVLLDHSVTIPTTLSRGLTFTGAPHEPLTVEFAERSRTDGSVLTVGAVRFPAPGDEVHVEFHVDVHIDGVIHLEIEDRANRVLHPYVAGQPHREARSWMFGERRMRLLAEGWTVHQPRNLEPDGVTDVDAATGETLATLDVAAELAGEQPPVARGWLLTGIGRPVEALGLLMPVVLERPPDEHRVPGELCAAVCAALARLSPRYRDAGIRALVDRLTYTITRPGYAVRHDDALSTCLRQVSELGRSPEVDALTRRVAELHSAAGQAAG